MDKADPLPDRGKLCEANEATGGLVISSSNTPAVFEAVEEALDLVSGSTQRPMYCVLDMTVLLGRDLWRATTGANFVADGAAVVALVAQHHRGLGVNRLPKRALTHFWWKLSSRGANNARLKEIELSAAIHLAFDELQLCDLPFRLAVRPG